MFQFLKPKQKIEVIRRDPIKLRLHEWRGDGDLVSRAVAVAANPDFKLMLDVLTNEHPAFSVLMSPTIEELAMAKARAEGYTLALSNLEALSKYERNTEPMQADFQPEEVPIPKK